MKGFEELLTGGHPNSLGNTLQVVEEILSNKKRLEELFQCYFSEDEVVRMRVSNAFKRVCREHPDWLMPYVDRFISEISKINQASTQWTFAQLMMLLDDKLNNGQRAQVVDIMKTNLTESDDWIVLNFTMEALTYHAKKNESLQRWLVPHLKKLSKDSRKSVARRAQKYAEQLHA